MIQYATCVLIPPKAATSNNLANFSLSHLKSILSTLLFHQNHRNHFKYAVKFPAKHSGYKVSQPAALGAIPRASFTAEKGSETSKSSDYVVSKR